MAQVLWWKFTPPGTSGCHLLRVRAPGDANQEVFLDGEFLDAPAGVMTFTGPKACLMELQCSPDGTWSLLVDGTPAEAYRPEAVGSAAEEALAGTVAWYKFTLPGLGTHMVRVAGIGEPTQEVLLDGAPIDAPPGTMAFTGPGASYMQIQKREGVWVLVVDDVAHHRQHQPGVAAEGQDRTHVWSFTANGTLHVLQGTYIARAGQEMILDGVLIPAPMGTTTFTGPGGVLLELELASGSWTLLVNGEPVAEQRSTGGSAIWTFTDPAGHSHEVQGVNIGRDDQQVYIDGALLDAPAGTTTFTGPGGVLLELSRTGPGRDSLPSGAGGSPGGWTLLVDGVDACGAGSKAAAHLSHAPSPVDTATPLPQGVSFDTETGKYAANLRVGGRFKHLGSFASPEEASQAYQAAKG